MSKEYILFSHLVWNATDTAFKGELSVTLWFECLCCPLTFSIILLYYHMKSCLLSMLNIGSALSLSSLTPRNRHVPCFLPPFSYILVTCPPGIFLLPPYLLLSQLSQEFSEAAYTWLCHTWVRGRQAVDHLPRLIVCGCSLPYRWLQQFLRTDHLTIEEKNVPL